MQTNFVCCKCGEQINITEAYFFDGMCASCFSSNVDDLVYVNNNTETENGNGTKEQ